MKKQANQLKMTLIMSRHVLKNVSTSGSYRMYLTPTFFDHSLQVYAKVIILDDDNGKRKLSPYLPIEWIDDIMAAGGDESEWMEAYGHCLKAGNLKPLEILRMDMLNRCPEEASGGIGCEDCKAHKPGWIEMFNHWSACDCNPDEMRSSQC